MYGMRGQLPIDPHPELRPIVRPGTSTLAVSLFTQSWPSLGQTLGLVTAFALGSVVLVVAALSAPIVAGLLVLAAFGWMGMQIMRFGRDVVIGPRYKLAGTEIRGNALDLLADIDGRFAYAERKIGDVPTGIEWREVAADVETIMWECAVHAVQASALDEELIDLRYSEPGTPQAALCKQVEARRDDHPRQYLTNRTLEAGTHVYVRHCLETSDARPG